MSIVGGFWIHITCNQCGAQQDFTRETKAEAIQAARVAGWTMLNYGQEYCKHCHTSVVTMQDIRNARKQKRAPKKP